MSERWSDLNSVTKNVIATEAAGIYRRNIFLALMNNYSKVIDNTTSAYESEGVAMQKQDIYMQGLQASLSKLENAWQRMYLATINNQNWKVTIEGLTGLLNAFNSIAEVVGGLPALLGLVVMSVITLKSSFRTGFFTNIIGSFKLVENSSRAASMSIKTQWGTIPLFFAKIATSMKSLLSIGFATGPLIAFRAAMTRVMLAEFVATGNTSRFTGALNALGFSFTVVGMKAAFATAATIAFQTAATMGLAIVFTAVMSKGIQLWDNFINREEKAKEKFEELKNSITGLESDVSQTQKAIIAYEELANKTATTTEEKEKLAKSIQTLSNLYPDIVEKYDSEGNAIEINTTLLKEYLAVKKEELKYKKEELTGKFYSPEGQDNLDALKELQKERRKLIDKIETNKKQNSDPNIDYLAKKWNTGEIEEDQKDLNKILSESAEKISQFKTQLVAILETNDKFKSMGNSGINLFVKTITDNLDLIGGNDQLNPFLDNLQNTNFSDVFATATNELKNFEKQTEVTEKESIDFQNKIKNLFKQYFMDAGLSEEASSNLALVFSQKLAPSVKLAKDAVMDMSEEWKNFADILEDCSKKLDTLSSIKEKLNKGESMSVEDIKNLADMGINAENASEALEKIKQKEQELKDQIEKNYQDKKMLDGSYYLQRINNSNDYFSKLSQQYGLDSIAFQNLADLKYQTDIKLIEKLMGAWADYYEVSADGVVTLNQVRVDEFMNQARANLELLPRGSDAYVAALSDMYRQKTSLEVNVYNLQQALNKKEKDFRDNLPKYSGHINYKEDKSSSKSTPSSIDYIDTTKAHVESFNTLVDEDKVQEKLIQKQITTANNAKDYIKEIQLQNDLLKIQQKTVTDLQTANEGLHQEANKVRSKSKYDTSTWFDMSGKDTEAYLNLLNSFAEKTDDASKKEVENIKRTHDALSLIKSAWQANSEAVDTYGVAIDSTKQKIEDITFESINSNLAVFDKQLEQAKYKLDDVKNKFSLYTIGTSEYKKVQEELNEATQDYNNLLADKATYIQKEILNDAISIAQKEQLKDTLEALNREQKENIANIQSQIASQADEIISIYKEIYEKQKDIALDSIDKQLDAEEKRHDTIIDYLDEELDKYEEIIQAKLDLIDEEADEEDYTKNLTKAQKERQDIQNKINVLSLDDSIENKLKIDELNKELVEKDEALEEMQNKHSKDLRKKNLSDQLEKYKKDVEAKKDSENEKFKTEKNRLDAIKNETTKYWDNIINNERKFAQIRKDIIDGNLSEVQSDFDRFQIFINNNMESIGESISNNLVDKMQATASGVTSVINQLTTILKMADEQLKGARKLAQQSGSAYFYWDSPDGSRKYYWSDDPNLTPMNSKPTQSQIDEHYGFETPTTPTNPNNNSNYSAYKSLINEIVYNKGIYEGGVDGRIIKTPTQADKDYASAQAAPIYDKLPNDLASMLRGMGYTEAYSWYKTLHTGGIVGNELTSNSKLTEIINKLFNTQPNEQVVKMLKGELAIPAQNIVSNFIPNMKNFINSLTPQINLATSGVSSGDTIYNLNFNIEKITGDKNGGKVVFNEIVKGLKGLGMK